MVKASNIENFIIDFDGVQVVNLNYDIVQNIFNNNSAVYWGFTATTGGSFNNQSIRFTNTSAFSPINDLVICETDTVTINSPVTTTNYLWSPNTFIDNNSSATPNFNPTTTTTYTTVLAVLPTVFGPALVPVLTPISAIAVPAIATGVTVTALVGATVYATSKGV